MKAVPKKYGVDYFTDNFLDDFFNDSFFKGTGRNLMKTDIKENKDEYVFKIDMPGFEKDDIKIHYDDGYLNILAEKNDEKEEKDKDGEVIRQERYEGRVARSFYLGKNLDEGAFKANYKNGVLKLTVPKKELIKAEEKKYIEVK